MINWKESGCKRSWPYCKLLSPHSPEGTNKNTKNVIHDSPSPGRDLNGERHVYETGILITRLRRSVYQQ
jgi:hypothetical protein